MEALVCISTATLAARRIDYVSKSLRDPVRSDRVHRVRASAVPLRLLPSVLWTARWCATPDTGLPIVPGSSLKGKLRTLLARSLCQDIENMPDLSADDARILRLFGSAEPVRRSRLQFADAFLTNAEALSSKGVRVTEVETENTISRANAQATPRQIERVIAGAVFGVSIVYDVTDPAQVEEDLALLAKGMKLLQWDYLGGHGSRGSGRVSLKNFTLKNYGAPVELDSLKALFDEVDSYELFSV